MKYVVGNIEAWVLSGGGLSTLVRLLWMVEFVAWLFITSEYHC
jgi:hypothetical protein